MKQVVNLKDYIQGKRHGKEANKLERKALNDAFLQDALDGFDAVQGEHVPLIEELQKQILTPKSTKKITLVWRWAVAVIAFLLIGTSLLEIFNINNKNIPQTAIILKSQKNNIEIKKIDSTEIADNVKLQTRSERNIKEYHIPTIDNENIDTEQSTNNSVNGYIAKNMLEEKSSNEKSIDGFNSLSNTTSNTSFAPVNMNDNAPLKQKIGELRVNSTDQYAWLRDSIKTNWDSTLQGRTAGLSTYKSNSYGNAKNIIDNVKVRGMSSITSLSPIQQTRGRLLDENGEPLVGASVVIKGTNNGVSTNFDGDFTLPIVVACKDSLLVVSYIGYEKKEIPIKENVGDIKLLADNKSLNEVVVVGYGAVKKMSTVGSVSPIKTKEFTFGKKEFIYFFKENYDKTICSEQIINISAKIELDKFGHPINITNIITNCEQIEAELRKWLEKSPNWNEKNKIVTIKFSTKD